MAVNPIDKQAAREETLLHIAAAISDGVVSVAGDVELGATTVTSLQTAFATANEGIRTDLAGVADSLNGILGELLDKIEAGEDVGLTDEAINELATAIATLFHYPTDYPDSAANTKLNDIKTLIAALPTASPLTDTQLRATPVPVSGTVAVSNQVANPTDFPDAAAQIKLEALHTDNGSATTTPPTSGTGIIGWLRGIYDKVAALPTTTPQTNALTDGQLRATPVAVSVSTLPLPSGAATAANQTNGTQATKLTNGVQTADTVAGDTDKNSLLVSAPDKVIPFSVSGTGAVTGLSAVDTAQYRWASITFTTFGVTTSLNLHSSNDSAFTTLNASIQGWFASSGTNGVSNTGGRSDTNAMTSVNSPLGATAVFPTLPGKYLRLNCATYVNPVSGVLCLFATPPPAPNVGVVAVAGNSGGTITVDTELPAAAAVADTLTNPTAPQIASDNMLFNGTNWDRFRNNANVAVDTSSARGTSGVGTTATNFNGRGAVIFIPVTAVSGTSPTMTVRVQVSYDGTTFVDLDTTNAQTATINATGTYVLHVYPGLTNAANSNKNAALPRTWRLAWALGGTTPSFTFSTTAAYVI